MYSVAECFAVQQCTGRQMKTAILLVQVSVYDTINKDAQYSLKVRRLGEYHPELAATKDQEGQDIGDPLYGNAGGVDELVGCCNSR